MDARDPILIGIVIASIFGISLFIGFLAMFVLDYFLHTGFNVWVALAIGFLSMFIGGGIQIRRKRIFE